MDDRIEIVIDEHTKLVGWKDTVTEYNEMCIYLEKDGYIYQDLVLVRQRHSNDDGSDIIHVPGEYQVLVWGDKDDEDYTNLFDIEERKDDE